MTGTAAAQTTALADTVINPPPPKSSSPYPAPRTGCTAFNLDPWTAGSDPADPPRDDHRADPGRVSSPNRPVTLPGSRQNPPRSTIRNSGAPGRRTAVACRWRVRVRPWRGRGCWPRLRGACRRVWGPCRRYTLAADALVTLDPGTGLHGLPPHWIARRPLASRCNFEGDPRSSCVEGWRGWGSAGACARAGPRIEA